MIVWRDVFTYKDGELYRIKRSSRRKPSRWYDRPAGSVDKSDASRNTAYKRVKYRGKNYRVHRIIWEMHFGEIPSGYVVDHINGNGLDNRIENLRLAKPTENQYNTRVRKDNTSGVRGVCWHKATGKWSAAIRINGRARHLGLFDDIDTAKSTRLRHEKELHGEFRPMYLTGAIGSNLSADDLSGFSL